jgi:hypothetical protein
MHIRHLAVVDAIAPPGVTTNNVEIFSRVELRSLRWREAILAGGLSHGPLGRPSSLGSARAKLEHCARPLLLSATNSALRSSTTASTYDDCPAANKSRKKQRFFGRGIKRACHRRLPGGVAYGGCVADSGQRLEALLCL